MDSQPKKNALAVPLQVAQAHTAVIDRLVELDLLQYTTSEGRMSLTESLLRGHCVVIGFCTCGECKPPDHFSCFATFKNQPK